MIITKTPFRISFVGGGSDMKSFYSRHEGCVLSTSINKYMYIVVHPTFRHDETIIKYNKTEIVSDIHDIRHPIARELLIDHNLSGLEIVSTADVPSGTGLSTSSAYTVGLIHALYAYKGKYCSQERIAREACELEINKLKEPIGKQDQYGTAIGGLKLIRFLPNERVEVEPVIISCDLQQELNSNLLMFYTGFTHSAGEILSEQNAKVISDERKYKNLIRMTELTYEMRDVLVAGDLDRFGEILDENWRLKQTLASRITNSSISYYYDLAMQNGALGGKLLGAGGGGFLLFYCPKQKQPQLRKAMSDLTEMSFRFEQSGTKVIYVGEKDW